MLTIDLVAVADNYRTLAALVGRETGARAVPIEPTSSVAKRDPAASAALTKGAACAAVVKADAYGLGAAQVAPALFEAGCRFFFVAHLEEALAVRRVIPREAVIAVMHGVFAGGEPECVAGNIIPVSNSLAQLGRWADQARAVGRRLPAILQIDTGMARFGLPAADLPRARDQLGPLALTHVMSHLACADTPDDPANAEQRARFERARALFPNTAATLAASSGTFLGAPFHYDLVRPGAALYGVAPVTGVRNPMKPVIRLDAKVVQCRDVPAGTPVGYGHTARTTAPARLATIAVGYADGYLRSGSNQGAAWFGDVALPIMGRISMDSIVLDASTLPDGALNEGDTVELIGPHRGVDAVAAEAGTIGYEVLTSLGQRYHRVYRAAGDAA